MGAKRRTSPIETTPDKLAKRCDYYRWHAQHWKKKYQDLREENELLQQEVERMKKRLWALQEEVGRRSRQEYERQRMVEITETEGIA